MSFVFIKGVFIKGARGVKRGVNSCVILTNCWARKAWDVGWGSKS